VRFGIFDCGLRIHLISDFGLEISDCKRMAQRAKRIALDFSEIPELLTCTLCAMPYALCAIFKLSAMSYELSAGTAGAILGIFNYGQSGI